MLIESFLQTSVNLFDIIVTRFLTKWSSEREVRESNLCWMKGCIQSFRKVYFLTQNCVMMKIYLYFRYCHIFFYSLRKTYGGLFTIKLGSWRTVVAASPESIKEVLVTKSADFAGRLLFYSISLFTFG